MPISDRAFRALARNEPSVIATLLRVIAPAVVPVGAPLTPDDVATSQLDALPPALDVDWVARAPGDELLHVECQGYRDPGFVDRLFWYHLRLALRDPRRRVRSVAIWLTRPSQRQRVDAHAHGDITVRMTTVVLENVSAASLLADPETACFASGADAGAWTSAELCERVAAVMAAQRASYYQRHMAVVAAATRGRYADMVKAMGEHDMEPVIIEDLVRFGRDEGRDEGRAEGRREVFARIIARKLGRALTPDEELALARRVSRIDDEVFDLDAAGLAAWLAADDADVK
jgi:hypothetical protein